MRDEDNRGKFSVYVGVGDTKKEIEVDTLLPFVQSRQGQMIPAFCQIDNQDIWPLILEKAILKAHRAGIFFGNYH